MRSVSSRRAMALIGARSSWVERAAGLHSSQTAE
jgi:hypothetical protein